MTLLIATLLLLLAVYFLMQDSGPFDPLNPA